MFDDSITFWIVIGIAGIIGEFFSGAFLSIGFATAGFVTAIYAWFFRDAGSHNTEYIIFATCSILFAYAFPSVLPKLLRRADELRYQSSTESMIGREIILKQVENQWKTTIDGVDYLIDNVPKDAQIGEHAQITGHDSGKLHITLIRG